MSVSYIKEIYGKPDVQDDLNLDAIELFSRNITYNFKKFNGRTMTSNDVKKLVNFFKEKLYHYNDIDIEWDQTS